VVESGAVHDFGFIWIPRNFCDDQGAAWYCRPYTGTPVELHPTPKPNFFKITDGWKNFRLIFGLAELSR